MTSPGTTWLSTRADGGGFFDSIARGRRAGERAGVYAGVGCSARGAAALLAQIGRAHV